MRRILTISLVLLFFSSYTNGSNTGGCLVNPSQIDSMHYMKWDKTNGSWFLEYIRHYGYNESDLSSLLLLDGPTRDTVWRWNYYYNSQNKRDFEVLVRWNGLASTLSQKKESVFNSENQKVSELISNWKNGVWIPNINSLFEYSNGKLVVEIAQVKDKNGVFFNNQYINYLYINNALSEVTTQRVSDGVIIRRQLYTYNASGKLKEVIYFQLDPTTSTGSPAYLPVSRRTYSYDMYLNNSSILFENWVTGAWEISANYISFRKIDTAKKVSVCHKGKTICVAKSALPAFLKQGSTLGQCPVNQQKKSGHESFSSNSVEGTFTLTVYPNPAIHSVTISGLSQSVNRIDIYNSAGSLVNSIQNPIGTEQTISRNGLPAGTYFINVIGNNYNQTKQVIFK